MALELVCKNCSARMPKVARFCPNCGTAVPEPEPVPAQGIEPDSVATVDGENGAPALTVPAPEPPAGPEPEHEHEPQQCPACGFPIRPGASFCERCSHRLWTPGSARAESRTRDFGVSVGSGSLSVREAALRQAVALAATVPARAPARTVATCPRCGTGNWFGDASCSKCGLPLEHFSVEGIPYRVARLGRPAGFWVRFIAFLVDIAIVFGIGAVVWPVLFDETFWIAVGTETATGSSTLWRTQNWHVVIWLSYSIVCLALFGATPGKRIFRMRVYDDRHRRGIGFASATVRVVAMWLSAFALLAGFVMAGIRKDKRSLHDLIAGTYPTRKF